MALCSNNELKRNTWSVIARQRARNERFSSACNSCAGETYSPELTYGKTTLDDIEHYYDQETSLRTTDLYNKHIIISARENLSLPEQSFSIMKISMHQQTVGGMKQASKYGSSLEDYLNSKMGII